MALQGTIKAVGSAVSVIELDDGQRALCFPFSFKGFTPTVGARVHVAGLVDYHGQKRVTFATPLGISLEEGLARTQEQFEHKVSAGKVVIEKKRRAMKRAADRTRAIDALLQEYVALIRGAVGAKPLPVAPARAALWATSLDATLAPLLADAEMDWVEPTWRRHDPAHVELWASWGLVLGIADHPSLAQGAVLFDMSASARAAVKPLAVIGLEALAQLFEQLRTADRGSDDVDAPAGEIEASIRETVLDALPAPTRTPRRPDQALVKAFLTAKPQTLQEPAEALAAFYDAQGWPRLAARVRMQVAALQHAQEVLNTTAADYESLLSRAPKADRRKLVALRSRPLGDLLSVRP